MGVIKKQGVNNLIIGYIAIFIGFASVIFVQPHFLAKQEIGLMRLLYGFSAMTAMFLPLGFGNILIRYFPHFRDSKNGHNGIFMLNLIFIFTGFIIVSAGILAFKGPILHWYAKESPEFAEYFYAIIPLSLFIAANSVFTAYCQVLFRSSFPSFVSDILSRLLTLALITVYYLKLINFDTLIWGYVLQYFVQMLVLLVYIHIVDKPGYRLDWNFVKSKNISAMLGYGLLLSLSSFASLGIKLIDGVLLGHFVPLAQLGIYSVAVMIPTIIEAPIAALEKISNAKIADEWAKMNLGEISKIYSQSTRYLMLIGGFLMICVNLNAAYLFELLPKDFSGGLHVVYIVSIGTFFNMATGLNGSILFSSSSYVYGSFLLFLLLALVIINCLIFIPLFGIDGAALSIMISSLIYNLLKYLLILKKYRMQPFDQSSLKITGLILVCYAAVWLIPSVHHPIIDILIHGTAVLVIYGAGTIALRIAPEFHHMIPFLPKENKEH